MTGISDFPKKIWNIFDIGNLFIKIIYIVVLTTHLPAPPLPAPRFPRKDFLRPSEMSDLRSQRQFLWSQKLFHFTLFQRKKCTKYHFISNILLQICTFQNVYEQRQYWCSINAIAPRYFILKSFSTKIQKSFFFFCKNLKKRDRKGI